jgi:hypothetical protein
LVKKLEVCCTWIFENGIILMQFISVCEFSFDSSVCAIGQEDGPTVTAVWLALLIDSRSAGLNALKDVLRGLPQDGVRLS